jgi:hypothetical protein
MHQPLETSPFKKLTLQYHYGMGKIYTQEEIDKIRNSRSFEREFNCKFLGLEGNVLSPIAVDRCIKLGEEMNKTAPLDNWDIQTKYVMSIDIGWGSSNTAIMVSRYVNGKVQIIYSREFERPLFQNVIDEIWELKTRCADNLQNILVDAANTELYTSLCNEFKQNPSLQYLQEEQERCKQFNSYLGDSLFICPIPFNVQGRNMLNHTPTDDGRDGRRWNCNCWN